MIFAGYLLVMNDEFVLSRNVLLGLGMTLPSASGIVNSALKMDQTRMS